jgi:hypothetical protein
VGHTTDLLESRNQSEIVAVGYNVDVIPGGELTDGGMRFVVNTKVLRPMIERIWAVGGEVVRVNPMRRSLEDIFVELTSEPPEEVGRYFEDKERKQGTPTIAP